MTLEHLRLLREDLRAYQLKCRFENLLLWLFVPWNQVLLFGRRLDENMPSRQRN